MVAQEMAQVVQRRTGEKDGVGVGGEGGGEDLVGDAVGTGGRKPAEPLVMEGRDRIGGAADVAGTDRDTHAEPVQHLAYDGELGAGSGVHGNGREPDLGVGGEQAQGQCVVGVAGLHVENDGDGPGVSAHRANISGRIHASRTTARPPDPPTSRARTGGLRCREFRGRVRRCEWSR